MPIGKRLSDLLDARSENVNSIATQISVSPQTIYSIIKRDNMKVDFDVLMKLARALNVSVEYFYEPQMEQFAKQSSLDTEEVPEDVQRHVELYTQLSSAGRQAADDNVFTLLMFQQAMEKQAVKACDTRIDELATYRSLRKSEQAFSAGRGVYLGPEAFDLIHVQDNELTRRATFCGAVDGDSMEPRYHDGNVLLVNSDEEVEVGEIGIFTLDGHGYVKKRGRGELISLNPSYNPIPLDDSIRCNGKVIGILNPEWIVEE